MFTSVAPGADMARLAREHDVDLLLVDAPDGLLEDARVLGAARPAHRATWASWSAASPGAGSVARALRRCGARLGGRRARRLARPGVEARALRLVGAATSPDGRDASRLLAHASIAVQRALGVPAEPVLVDPHPEALVEAASGAGVVVVGLTDRWRRDGARSRPHGARDAGDRAGGARPSWRSVRAASRRATARRASPGRSPADGSPTAPTAGGVAFRQGCAAGPRRRSRRRGGPPKVCSTRSDDADRLGDRRAARRRRRPSGTSVATACRLRVETDTAHAGRSRRSALELRLATRSRPSDEIATRSRAVSDRLHRVVRSRSRTASAAERRRGCRGKAASRSVAR